MIVDSITPVLVQQDTIYQREDHAKRLLVFQRPQIAASAVQPFFMLGVKRPSNDFFLDRFVSVVPVVEAFQQTGAPPNQPYLAYIETRPNRIDDFPQEDQFRRVNQQALFSFIHGLPSPDFLAYTFTLPDLCDDPWLELVHRPASPEGAIFPFRQIYAAPQVNQILLQMFYKSPNWRIEAEPIWNVPATNNETLQDFLWQQILPVVPNVVGLSQSSAIALLNFDGFFNLSVVDVINTTVTPGLVASQSVVGPVANFTVPVTINVSIGSAPSGSIVMPNVVGLILQEALLMLEQAGVLVPKSIGYFGVYPITVVWIPYTERKMHNIVEAQSVAANAAVIPNASITLYVYQFPMNVTFPGGGGSIQ